MSPDNLEDFFKPECRQGLSELHESGVKVDMNATNHWRLVGRHNSSYRGKRAAFPLWLSQLLFNVQRRAEENVKAEIRDLIGASKSRKRRDD